MNLIELQRHRDRIPVIRHRRVSRHERLEEGTCGISG